MPDFLVLVGIEDEAFLAREFKPTMKPYTDKGEYVLLEGTGHLGMVTSERAAAVCLRFLKWRDGTVDEFPGIPPE